jgi:molybdopterin biosynthesis enzyme
VKISREQDSGMILPFLGAYSWISIPAGKEFVEEGDFVDVFTQST